MKKKKSWLTTYFVLIVAAVFCLQLVLSFGSVEEIPPIDAAVSISGFSGGTGTSTNPYLISDVSDLNTLANHVNSGKSTANTYFKLTTSLDLSGQSLQIGKRSSSGSTYYFDGTFDGGGNVIYNFSISSSSTYSGYLGLFGYCYGDIKNLRMSGGSVYLTKSYGAGAFVGYLYGGTIQNCFNLSCSVSTSSNISGTAYCGGIVGYASSTTSITQCLNYANVSCYFNSSAYAGGIIGRDGGTATINECFNDGYIYAGSSSYTSNAYAAGISAYAGYISNCFNLGSIYAYAKQTSTTYYFGLEGTGYKYNNNYYIYDYNSKTYKLNNNYNDNSIKSATLVYGKNNIIHVRILKDGQNLCYRTTTSENSNAYGIAYNPDSVRYCYNAGSFSSNGYSGNTTTRFYGRLYDGLWNYSSYFTITASFYNYDKSGPIANKNVSYGYYYRDSSYNAYSTFRMSGAASASGTYDYEDYNYVNQKLGVKLGGTTQYVRYVGTNSYNLWMYDEDYDDKTRENFLQMSNASNNYSTTLKYNTTPSAYDGSRYTTLSNLKNAVLNNFGASGSKWVSNDLILNGYPHFSSIFWPDNATEF